MTDFKPLDHREALKTSGIEQLSAPGTDTNYLDWAFVVKLHLAANDLSHVLLDVPVKDRPPSTILGQGQSNGQFDILENNPQNKHALRS